MADKDKAEAKKAKAPKGGEAAAKPDKAAKAKEQAAAKKAKEPRTEGAAGATHVEEAPVIPRLRTHFDQVVRSKLTEQFGYQNKYSVPTITKVVVNMGIGEGAADRKKVDQAAEDLSLITGQKAVITKAKKSIATFKVRDGQAIGCKVTLRKARMFEFLDRLVTIALPRVRDFRGLNPKSFDGRGNYTLGIKEHIIFPEIDYDKAADVWGMDITICTTARTDEEARVLLANINFPFRQ